MSPPDTTRHGARAELGWIDWIRGRAAGAELPGSTGAELPGSTRAKFPGSTTGVTEDALRLGIGDDCAILRLPEGHELLVTTDFSLEGRHFRRDWHSPESAGHRTLARGLSDLAAMGARPSAAFLSLAIPRRDAQDPAWTEGFLNGLLTLAERFETPLAGGDTAEAPGADLLADIVLLGTAPAGTALRRSGAQPGDGLYVTGSLGGAAAELEALAAAAGKADGATAVEDARREEARHGRDHPQLYPEPRIGMGDALRRSGFVTACLDLSDGLSTDLAHLCSASGVSAVVSLELLPASVWLGDRPQAQRERLLLHGGEDYELLFTAKPGTVVPEWIEGVPINRIGSILPRRDREPPVMLRRGDQTEPLLAEGWEHLRG